MASLFSTTSQIAAINTRARSGVITLPLTTASLYRQIMIKDLYGSFPLSTLTISTQSGDFFEDGTTSRILSNAYEFQALYAGSTSRWHTVGGSQITAAYISSLRVDSLQLGSGDGWADFGPLRAIAISSILIQTGLIQANAMSTFAISTGTLTAGNISVATMSTNFGFFSTISSGSFFGRHIGDGSLLTGLPAGGLTIIPPVLSTTTLSTNLLTASNISTNSISTNNLTVSNIFGTGITVLPSLSANTISTNQVNSAGISNSGLISTVSLNVGSLSSINISTLNLAAGFISTLNLGADRAFITNLFVGTEDFGSALTASSNITQTGGTTVLAGLSVNTISTNQVNSGNICNAGWFSNNGILSNTTAGAFFQATSNTTTLGVAQTATFASNITQTGGTTVLAGLSVNTISTNQVNSAGISNSGVISTLELNVGSLSSINISTLNLAAGFISTLNLGANSAYITNLFVGSEDFGSSLTASSNIIQTGGTTILAGLSVNTISTNQVNSGNICNAGWFSNNGVLSNTTAGAFFQATSNTTTLGVAQTATFASNITQTGGTTILAGLSVNTISTNQVNSAGISNSGLISTVGLNVGSLSSINISTVNLIAGFISTLNLGADRAYITNLFVGTEDFGSALTASSNITQTGGTTVLAGLSVNTISTSFLRASNISTISLSTNFGFFSTISTGSVFGRHIGDGSLLTNLPIAGVTSILSTQAFFTSSISTANINSVQGYISSLTVDFLAIGSNVGFINMGDIIATSLSSIAVETQTLTTSNLRVGTVSSLSFIAFPGLQQRYTQGVIAEQSTGTGLQELLVFRGSSASDRIRMQTTGSIVFEPGVSARVFPAVPSNVTPAMIINTSSNVGIGIAAPTVTLDVAGAGRFTAVSTNTLSTSQVNSASISNSGIISTLGLNVGSLSSINISTVNLAAGFISTLNLGARSAYITNLFVGTEDFGSILTASSNITQTGGTTTLAGLSVNTISTNQINSSNICNAGFLSNNGIFSNITAAAFFQNTSNTGTLGLAGVATFSSNIIQTGGTTVLAGLSVNTISTNTIFVSSLAASEGFISTLGSELSFSQGAFFSTITTENLTGQQAYLSTLIVDSIQIGQTTGFITMGDVLTNSISTNTLNSSNISNTGNLSNGGSATFFSNGFTAASPSTTNAYPYASFKINSASTNTLTPVTPLLLMTGTYGGSIAGGLTQGVGSVLSLGTIPDGGATQEGYRLTGSNSAFYGNVDMQGNNISNVSSIYGSGNILEINNSSDINLLCGGNLYMYTNSGQFNGIYNGSSYVQIDPSQNINISSAGNIALNGNIVNINTSTINLRGITDSAIRIGPSQYQGIAADTTTYGLERSRHEIRFAGYRDAQIDKIGSKIVNINKQTYGNSGLRHLIQSADLAFFTVPPDTSDIDNTVERMRITDSGTVGIGITAPTVTLDVAGAGRFIALSTNTISSGTVFGRFIGDGSGLTGLPAAGAGVTNNLSTLAFYTSSISSTTIQTSNIRIGTISSQSFLAYPGLQQGYAQTVIAEQSTGTGLQELLVFRGSSASDRIRLQTTGFIVFETGVGARTFPSVGSNATPSWMIDVNGCVGVGLIPSGTQNRLDVAGQGRFQTLSTTSIQAGSMNLSVAFV